VLVQSPADVAGGAGRAGIATDLARIDVERSR
jgi:hypothetical protein